MIIPVINSPKRCYNYKLNWNHVKLLSLCQAESVQIQKKKKKKKFSKALGLEGQVTFRTVVLEKRSLMAASEV